MINGSRESGIAIAEQRKLIEDPFQLGHFSTLKALSETYTAFKTHYNTLIPPLISSAEENCEVPRLELMYLTITIKSVITQVQLAKYGERIKQERDNAGDEVMKALVLAEEHLTKMIALIDEVIGEVTTT